MGRRLIALAVVLAATACGSSPQTMTSPSAVLTLSGAVTRHEPYPPSAGLFPVTLNGVILTITNGPNAGRLATTGTLGVYSFTDLTPSTFTLNVVRSGYVSQLITVDLTASKVVDVVLTFPTVTLTGRVLDADTTGPIAGAQVSINGRYVARTDAAGRYTATGFLDAGGGSVDSIWTGFDGYENDYRMIRGTTQDFPLHRIERIAAGSSKVVTVTPADTICVNNVQDFGFGDQVCRSIRAVASSDGVLTIEATSTTDGTRPLMEVETVGLPNCCSERMGNPTSLVVAAGTEVKIMVEMPMTATASRSFLVKTSLSSALSATARGEVRPEQRARR